MIKKSGMLLMTALVVVFVLTLTACSLLGGTSTETFTLTVTSENPAEGSVTGGGNYEAGDYVILTATSQSGFAFEGWYKDDVLVSEQKSFSVKVTESFLLTARFRAIVVIKYTLTVNSEDLGKGKLVGGGQFSPGENVVVWASATEGYQFEGWYNGSEKVSENDTYGFYMPENSLILTARFTEKPTEPPLEPDGLSRQSALPLSTDVMITATVTIDSAQYKGRYGVWYQFTPVIPTTYTVESFETAVNPYVYLFDSTDGNAIKENDDHGGAMFAFRLQHSLSVGVTYYFFVATSSNGTSGSIPFKLTYVPVYFNINYDLDGGTNHPENPVNYRSDGAELTLCDPTKDGYDFSGWMPEGKILANSVGEKHFTAIWKVIPYDIVYKLNGGTNHTWNPDSYTVEDADIVLENPLHPLSFNFLGWFTTEEFTDGTEVTGIAEGSVGHLRFYAKWDIPSFSVALDNNGGVHAFTVSFETDGGSVVADQRITEYDALTYPKPTRDGYLFAGWYEDNTYAGDPFDFSATVKKDVRLYAKWIYLVFISITNIEINTATETITHNGYPQNGYYLPFVPLVTETLRFETENTLGRVTISLSKSDMIPLSDSTSSWDNAKAGFQYSVTAGTLYYVYISASLGTGTASCNVKITGTSTPTAGGRAQGFEGTLLMATYGQEMPPALPPVREGYTFLGYYDDKNVKYYNADMTSAREYDILGEVTLYALWG